MVFRLDDESHNKSFPLLSVFRVCNIPWKILSYNLRKVNKHGTRVVPRPLQATTTPPSLHLQVAEMTRYMGVPAPEYI